MSRLLSKIVYHATTLYLFTKSDIMSVLIPVSVLACTSAPLEKWDRPAHVIVWTWLHLLQANISNQTIHPEEDEVKKPYRPITSQRMSLRNAKVLRLVMTPLCLLFSSMYGYKVVKTSAVFAILVILYNECGLGNNFATRGLLKPLALACFETGSTHIAGSWHHHSDFTFCCIVLCSEVFATTVFVQDFRDVKGDARHGRMTLPIVFPTGARVMGVVVVLSWSIFLSHFWPLPPFIAIVFMGLAGYVGLLIVQGRTSAGADERSYFWYNVWLIFVHILPVIHRYMDYLEWQVFFATDPLSVKLGMQ